MEKYIIGLIAYFVVLISVGITLLRKNPDFDAYFYGNRRLGSFRIFFTITAAWFGAASTLATVEAAHKNGFQAFWLLGIPTIATLLFFIVINTKIREFHFVSLPVLLGKYYGKAVSGFASFLIFFYMILLAASQFVAWGKFISPFIGQGYEITIISGAIIVILYSYLGGYVSLVITDGIKLLLVAFTLVYLMVFFKGSPTLYNPGDFDFLADSSYHILMTISFTLAWIISPIIWQRIASAGSAKFSRRGLVMSVIALSLLYFMVINVGIYLRGYNNSAAGSADIFGVVIKNWLPTGGSLLVFIGIASAIMCTAATAINVGALTLVKDVLPLKRKVREVHYAKIATFVCGLLAAIVAIRFDSIIKTLGLASEIMAEGLFIPGMYLLFFKKKRPLAALLSLLLGGGFSILVFLNAYGFSLPLPQWPYSLPYGLGLSLLGFIIGYLLGKKK